MLMWKFLAQDVDKQPMFCLETAIKLLAFSWAVYDESCAPASSKTVCCNGGKDGKPRVGINKKDNLSSEQVRTSST